jgi:hypothetical protein
MRPLPQRGLGLRINREESVYMKILRNLIRKQGKSTNKGCDYMYEVNRRT